ncbi:MAG: CobD/CbiB family protein, partial [Rhodocyclaceae bacterium]|nr:CobD/CbiB family protein [Rhodocyclaceae bacterium]
LGDDADIEHLQSAVGLVWRALGLCLLLLALLTVASWVGQ